MIAEWTLISRIEASRRIRETADLGPRRRLTGGEKLKSRCWRLQLPTARK